MITLTQLNGQSFWLNPDLVERIEANPDTTLTMIDGKRYVAREHPGQIIAAIEGFRSRVISAARLMQTHTEGTT